MLRYRFAILELLEHEMKYAFAFLLLTFGGLQIISLFFKVFTWGMFLFCLTLLIVLGALWGVTRLLMEYVPSEEKKAEE